jgi:hypothetical protein
MLKQLLLASALALPFTINIAHATDPLPPLIIGQIRQQCAREWPTDFHMRVYCENKEYQAAQELMQRGGILDPIAPQASPSTELATNALKAFIFYTIGRDQCDLNEPEAAKLRRSATDIIELMGYSFQTIRMIPDSIFNAVKKEYPTVIDAFSGDKTAAAQVCPRVREFMLQTKEN